MNELYALCSSNACHKLKFITFDTLLTTWGWFNCQQLPTLANTCQHLVCISTCIGVGICTSTFANSHSFHLGIQVLQSQTNSYYFPILYLKKLKWLSITWFYNLFYWKMKQRDRQITLMKSNQSNFFGEISILAVLNFSPFLRLQKIELGQNKILWNSFIWF